MMVSGWVGEACFVGGWWVGELCFAGVWWVGEPKGLSVACGWRVGFTALFCLSSFPEPA